MPLKKILFRPGVNRENTRYASESLGSVNAGTNVVGGWYESEKVRFRQGTPEKIGGWGPLSTSKFLGVCRSLWNWITLSGQNLMGVGTNLKFYIEYGGAYYDITPIRQTDTLPTDPFTANGTSTITVNAPGNDALQGDFVTFSGATAFSGVTLNGEFQITEVITNGFRFTYTSSVTAGSGGGASVQAEYQINTGAPFEIPITGWGAGGWGEGDFGTGEPSDTTLRLWSQQNFGEDLVFGPKGGPLYYWDATPGLTTRAVLVSSLAGATDVPTVQNIVFVSDISRFVLCFGCNDYGSVSLDAMLIRWSDQESVTDWTPTATNQAGSIRLSHGSNIVSIVQTRQEIVVITDSSVYSLQYQGPPVVWGAQLLGDNISIVSQNAAVMASGRVFWMGVDKFYVYDGRVQTLRCDLRQYIYSDINLAQQEQFFSGSNEGFNEVWWFYCSSNSSVIDRYVVYNYSEDIWYYGTMERTAWLDSGLRSNPSAVSYIDSVTIGNTTTYGGRILFHEYGTDDNVDGEPQPMVTSISSSEFDLEDGHQFGFVYRILPDITFRGSSAETPQVTMTLIPLANSGSGYNNPQSEGGVSYAAVQRTTTVPVEKFTGQVFVRVRGRQMVFKVNNEQLGSQWQLGAPRIDIKQDGRRGNS
jgi:hypothetical protein